MLKKNPFQGRVIGTTLNNETFQGFPPRTYGFLYIVLKQYYQSQRCTSSTIKIAIFTTIVSIFFYLYIMILCLFFYTIIQPFFFIPGIMSPRVDLPHFFALQLDSDDFLTKF